MYIVVMTLTIQSLQDRVGFWHERLAQSLAADLDRRLAPHGVSSAQFRLLIVLVRGESNTVRGVAMRLNLDGAAITRLADRLQAKGLLAREPDITDKRSVRLRLTETGRSLMPELIAAADEHERAWFGPLSFAELRQYKAVLAKLLQPTGTGPDPLWLRGDLLMGTGLQMPVA